MFEAQFGKSLDEKTFETWLAKGRESNLGYQYLMVVWNTFDEDYEYSFLSRNDNLSDFQKYLSLQKKVVAIYDIYTMSKINFENQ